MTKPFHKNSLIPKGGLSQRLKKWSFQQQLTLVFIASVTIFSFIGAVSTTLLDWHQNYDNLIDQGTQIARDFSRKSRLVLLYDITENIMEETQSTLNFPNVVYISIIDSNGKLILQRWKNKASNKADEKLIPDNFDSSIYDDGDNIVFTEKVFSKRGAGVWQSPFSSIQEESRLVGYAHVILSKKHFNETLYSTFIINIVIFVVFATITLAILLFIARRLSNPLNKLAQLMKQTQQGKFPKNINISGSCEIDNMVEAFNAMLDKLDERARNLDEKNKLLVKEIEDRKSAEKDRSEIQKQLLQAQKMEAIGQLTGGIAHDFNNILAAILGYSQLATKIADGKNEEKLRKYLQEINKGGERARNLVSQLLAFSRSKIHDEGELPLISIAPVINEVTTMLNSVIPSSIYVKRQIPSNLPDISVDPIQLHQAILNLCINARDAMQGKGTLHITAKYYEADKVCSSCHQTFRGKFLCISVSDTGTGIPNNIKDKLFEPFFTTKEFGKGSGMGLAMVHGIVHNHHGHLTVESTINKGTCFNLHFPISHFREQSAVA